MVAATMGRDTYFDENGSGEQRYKKSISREPSIEDNSKFGYQWTNDYFPGWKLDADDQKLYDAIVDHPAYGLFDAQEKGIGQAIGDWYNTRKDAYSALSWKGTPKALAKFAVNDMIDPYYMGVETWRGDNWKWEKAKDVTNEAGEVIGKEMVDIADNAGKWVASKTGRETLGKVARIGVQVPGKLLHSLPLIGSGLSIAADLQSGESVPRAIVGELGSVVGGSIGGAIGSLIGPVGTIGGGIGGAMIGDSIASNVYGFITGDKGPDQQSSQDISAMDYQQQRESQQNYEHQVAQMERAMDQKRQAQIERINNIRTNSNEMTNRAMQLSRQYLEV